jgi:hypothetical protein
VFTRFHSSSNYIFVRHIECLILVFSDYHFGKASGLDFFLQTSQL